MPRVVVDLPGRTHDALLRLADREMRPPRDQVLLLLTRGLEREGVLVPWPPADDSAAGAEPAGSPAEAGS